MYRAVAPSMGPNDEITADMLITRHKENIRDQHAVDEAIGAMSVDDLMKICMKTWRFDGYKFGTLPMRDAHTEVFNHKSEVEKLTTKIELESDVVKARRAMLKLLNYQSIFLNDDYVGVVSDALRRKLTKSGFPWETAESDDEVNKRITFIRQRYMQQGGGLVNRLQFLLLERRFADILSLMNSLPHPETLIGHTIRFDGDPVERYHWSDLAVHGSSIDKWEFMLHLANKGVFASALDNFEHLVSLQDGPSAASSGNLAPERQVSVD